MDILQDSCQGYSWDFHGGTSRDFYRDYSSDSSRISFLDWFKDFSRDSSIDVFRDSSVDFSRNPVRVSISQNTSRKAALDSCPLGIYSEIPSYIPAGTSLEISRGFLSGLPLGIPSKIFARISPEMPLWISP